MKIAICDTSEIPQAEVKTAIRAINIQLKRDFCPLWSVNASCVYVSEKSLQEKMKTIEAIIYLQDKPTADSEGALGYHTRNTFGMPYGYVFEDVCKELGEPWSVTLSHEVLEMALNRHVALYSIGPHPKDKSRNVLHWYEACDAVQAQTYRISVDTANGTKRIPVSDFVAPLYFTKGNELTPDRAKRAKNNFLETEGLSSFGLTPGGYIGYWDPQTGEEETIFADARAESRYQIKSRMGLARRRARVSELICDFGVSSSNTISKIGGSFG